MKYLKTFELTDSDKYNIRIDATNYKRKFKVGDYVRGKVDNVIYRIDDIGEFSVRLPYFLFDIKDETNSGWWEDDELEKLEDWEVAAIKYNL
jgi:hypothetical protein